MTYDGPNKDELFSIEDTGAGLLVAGGSSSVSQAEVWMMTVPYEGLTDMTDDPTIGWRYTQPQVDDYDGSAMILGGHVSSATPFAQDVDTLPWTLSSAITATASAPVWTWLKTVP